MYRVPGIPVPSDAYRWMSHASVFMEKVKFTDEEITEMYSILLQIHAALQDKKGQKNLRELPIYELGWYLAIERFLESKDKKPSGL